MKLDRQQVKKSSSASTSFKIIVLIATATAACRQVNQVCLLTP